MIRGTFIRVRDFLFCKRRFLLLAFIWFLGLTSGRYYAEHASATYLLLMRAAPQYRLSIIGLAVSVLLPFLISVGAVYFSQPIVLYILAYLYSLLFSFACCCLRIIFADAGWLIQFMLLFSHCMAIPFYCWFTLRYLNGKGTTFIRDSLIVVVAIFIAGTFDLLVISPFLAALI